jgi:trans-aconitate methyltransferase
MPVAPKDHPTEWDAASYHRLADPQFEWGLKVLGRLSLRGDEVVMDAGCGSGRLTEALLERLPQGRVIAIDRSIQMLDEARKTLDRFGNRVRYVVADIERIVLDERVHVVFSTATFHWIHDHDMLFRHLYACLIPGGRLHAQSGGGPNLARIHARAAGLLAEAPYQERFIGWRDPWNFQNDASTRERLERAGFTDVHTALELAPTVIADRERYKAFLRTVILRAHVARIGDEALAEQFLERMTELGAEDVPAFSLDYVRLNLEARRPGG